MNLTQKILYAILGFLVGNAVLFGVYFGFPMFFAADRTPYTELSVTSAVEIIESGKIKNAKFSFSQTILVDHLNQKYRTSIDSDETREALMDSITNYNASHFSNQVIVRESASKPFMGLSVFASYLLIFSSAVVSLVIITLLLVINSKVSANNSLS